MNDAGFLGKLKVNVDPVPTLKGLKSEPQAVSETVSNVCFICISNGLAMEFRENVYTRQLNVSIW